MTSRLRPEDPPRPWRLSARLLLVDPAERVLLVPITDSEGSWWDLPGGGVEAGETTVAAAVRETLEETGYAVPVELVGPACWTGEVIFRWLGAWHWSRQLVHMARVTGLATPVALALTDEESGTHGSSRWWSLAEIAEHRLAVPPFGHPDELADLVAGGTVDGALVHWIVPPQS